MEYRGGIPERSCTTVQKKWSSRTQRVPNPENDVEDPENENR